jgi:hypothetical protein
MRALLIYVFLVIGLCLSAQSTLLNPANLLKGGVAGQVLVTQTGGAPSWVDQSMLATGVNYWSLSGVDVVRYSKVGIGVNPTTALDVAGIINAGAGGATSGNVLIKARYDAWPAQALVTQQSSGAIGLAAYMYQSGSSQWRSSFDYGAISKCALLVGYDGFSLWAAPTENTAAGQVLTTQPSTVYQVSNLGVMLLSGRAVIGSTADNGTDRLQITGTARISSTLKLGGTVATIQTGNAGASLYLWDRGTLQVPTTYTADPSTAGNGELWQNLSGGEQNMKYRANDVNNRVALVERDLIGTEVLVSSSTYAIAGASTIRFDALSNNVTSTVGAGMDERYTYVVRCTRNNVNTITLTADSGYFFAIDGLAALTPINYICQQYEIFSMRRRASVIYINQ